MGESVHIGSLRFEHFPLFLAPMEGVTDPSFRALCKDFGADMVFTEFVSVEALVRKVPKSLRKITIYPNERPIGIQIFGAELHSMMEAVSIVEDMQPDVIDINYGCPVRKVVNKMCGAGILRDIPKMVELTRAVVREATRPVTVKTRLGWDAHTIRIAEVVERLQDVGIQAITIHARTRAQMYKGQADWSWFEVIKSNPRIHIPVIGNGDIDGPLKAAEYRRRFPVDGMMIGRAAIGRPWIFRQIRHYFQTGTLLPDPTVEERIPIIKRHLQHAVAWKGEKRGVLELRRHYANYFKGIPDFKPFRLQLLQATQSAEVESVLDAIGRHYGDFIPDQKHKTLSEV